MVLAAAEDPAWQEAAPAPAPIPAGAVLAPTDVPLLHGATLCPDARALRKLVRALFRAARESGEGGASLARFRSRRLDAHAIVRAAIARDGDALERLAGEMGVDGAALHVVAQLAAVPLLHGCAARLREQVPPGWAKGYCPVCGAWPTLAEMRGLDRTRRLRCGRCAVDWQTTVLHCPFCDEDRHDHLGSLLPEASEPTRRVDVCKSCKGYIKTITTLRPLPLRSLLMEDLATVEYDIAAHERGYTRPATQGYRVDVAVERKRRVRSQESGVRSAESGARSQEDARVDA